MGSWNETCILTNLPILYGSDVVALEAKNETEFYDCLEGSPFSTQVNVAVGKMGDYGNLEETSDIFQAVEKPKKIRFEYTDDNRFIVFCYKYIWDKIVNWCVNDDRIREGWNSRIQTSSLHKDIQELVDMLKPQFEKEGIPVPDFKKPEKHILEKQLYFVCRFLYRARVGFPENLQRGSQQLDTQCRKLLAQWTIDQANKIEQILKENE